MRALLIGLVGTVLAGGGAGASDCIVVQKETTPYAAASPVQRPDLAGAVFRVTRVASRREDRYVEAKGVTMRLGYEAYEIKGPAGVFVIRRDYVPGTPSIQPVSISGGDRSIRWGGPARPSLGDRVLDGPLSDFALVRRPCRSTNR